ncbi:MAG: FAD-dependent oxidoreductase [Desulfobacteraceae bacterium]|nr:FAD-dependent oxidoreductase [Desulfobacteraceae bacterium]
MAKLTSADFLVIGGGVMGLTLALALKDRHPDTTVSVIEKEPGFGLHASGRNSGVLHAGFYYSANSLKAKFTKQGNRRWTEYCLERNLPINQCGKLVVAKSESELDGLQTLYQRGKANDVALEWISAQQAQEIEPYARIHEHALFSPTTSTIDPNAILHSLLKDAGGRGIRLWPATAYYCRIPGGVRTSGGDIPAGYVVNAAGLYADKIARDFGFSRDYQILPFKGLYLYSDDPGCPLKTHIYPVPDLKYPFLGVHFTITVNQEVKVGPTAIPAFWRENYSGTGNFRWNEFKEILGMETGLFVRNDFGFRHLAFTEMQKYLKPKMRRLARDMVKGLDLKTFRKKGKPGIRAQPVNIKKNKLEMDFLYEGDNKSFHLINAVSPAFTCALPFSEFIVGKIEEDYE